MKENNQDLLNIALSDFTDRQNKLTTNLEKIKLSLQNPHLTSEQIMEYKALIEKNEIEIDNCKHQIIRINNQLLLHTAKEATAPLKTDSVKSTMISELEPLESEFNALTSKTGFIDTQQRSIKNHEVKERIAILMNMSQKPLATKTM